MRGRMSDAPSYSPPVELGAVMVGGTVSRVEQSNHPDFKAGEWVLGYGGWQEYELSDGSGLVKLGEIRLILPGRWAYWVCRALPPIWGCWISGNRKRVKRWWWRRRQRLARPLGRSAIGCRVVGVAGGAEKCRHAVEVLGFDECLDHHAADFADQL